jgi:outer membrane lipoprotein-sorting protein
LCSAVAGFCQGIKTLVVDFEKSRIEGCREETAAGTIYYDASGNLTIATHSPLDQIMVLSGNELLIYYPEEKKAQRLAQTTLFPFPFFQSFLGVVKEDYGLTELGYRLISHETRGDTLVTLWQPVKQVRQKLGDLTLSHFKTRIVSVEMYAVDGSLSSRAKYEDHVKYGLWYFPLRIATERYGKTDTVYESVRYSNPQFDIPLPDSVINFNMPPGIDIQELSW